MRTGLRPSGCSERKTFQEQGHPHTQASAPSTNNSGRRQRGNERSSSCTSFLCPLTACLSRRSSPWWPSTFRFVPFGFRSPLAPPFVFLLSFYIILSASLLFFSSSPLLVFSNFCFLPFSLLFFFSSSLLFLLLFSSSSYSSSPLPVTRPFRAPRARFPEAQTHACGPAPPRSSSIVICDDAAVLSSIVQRPIPAWWLENVEFRRVVDECFDSWCANRKIGLAGLSSFVSTR